MPSQEFTHSFAGGMHLDADPQFQPEGTYREASNWVLTPALHLLQERTAAPLLNLGKNVVGITALGNQEIIFSNGIGASEIGVLDGSTYTTVLSSSNFTLTYPVRATASYDYRGHRLVYWVDDTSMRWLDLDAPTTNIPDGLTLLANPAAPTLIPTQVGVGGNLATGVYQAAATMLTASKNEGPYSLFTGVVPILNEDPATTSRQELDGAPPQTPANGSITFSLTNLDPSYTYVQLVVATYIGSANTPTFYKLTPVALNGRTSLDVVYYSSEQHEGTVALGDILAQLPNYKSAEDILQKDGHLILAGLEAEPEPDIDWQAIANSIVLGPAIKELPFLEPLSISHYLEGNGSMSQDTAQPSESKEDYKNPLRTTDSKGLQRGEVYSFCLIPLYNNKRLDAYHIPASTMSGAFEVYTSLEQYPAGQGYPTGGIRHHRMPALAAQPLLGNNSIRILGVQELVKPDFSALTPTQQGKLTGYLIGMQPRKPANKSIIAQGILNPLRRSSDSSLQFVSPFTGHPDYQGVDNASASDNQLSKQYAAFYSPECTIIGNSLTEATALRQVGTLSGKSYIAAEKLTGPDISEFVASFLDYTQLTGTTNTSLPLLPPTLAKVPGQAYALQPELLNGEAIPIMASSQNGFDLLKVDISSSSGLPYQTGTPDFQLAYGGFVGTSTLRLRQNDNSLQEASAVNYQGVTTRPLYNVERVRTRQYGTLEQAIYFPIGQSTASSPAATFYEGDTFIGKVALQSSMQEYSNSSKAGSIRYLTMSYFFCESTVNVDYRHYVAGTAAQAGTVPYFPKQRVLWNAATGGVMQAPTQLGHATGYNQQYSFNNNLTPAFPRDYTVAQVTSFKNRLHYSAQAVEGEQLNAYRIFRANDYHDIPKTYGPITSLADVNNSLYVHTEDALYKSSFNERVTQESSAGEVVLGNGGLFPRPSQPVFSVGGGYAGSQHKLAAITTPQGHFFPDAKRGKVYVLRDGLEEISNRGLLAYFKETLPTGTNYRAYYDYTYERYLLVGTNVADVSYSCYNQKWVSFHDINGFVFSTARRNLQATNAMLYIPNEGVPAGSELNLITNPAPEQSKLFGGSHVHASNPTSQLAQFTLEQASGALTTTAHTTYGQDPQTNEVLYRTANDQYQVSAVRDYAGGRLHGKWLRTTWIWPSVIFPTLLRLITTTFQARFR